MDFEAYFKTLWYGIKYPLFSRTTLTCDQNNYKPNTIIG